MQVSIKSKKDIDKEIEEAHAVIEKLENEFIVKNFKCMSCGGTWSVGNTLDFRLLKVTICDGSEMIFRSEKELDPLEVVKQIDKYISILNQTKEQMKSIVQEVKEHQKE